MASQTELFFSGDGYPGIEKFLKQERIRSHYSQELNLDAFDGLSV